MTDRIGDEQLDGTISAFLAWQAEDIADAPTATEMAMRLSERASGSARGRLSPQLVWVMLAGLLILGLIGAAVGAGSLGRVQPPLTVLPPLSMVVEAVFLRLEVVDGASEILVVGVDSEGHERQIARLPGAWLAYGIGTPETGRALLAPMGAVSPNGLLAIPGEGGGHMMHWEIFDLQHPEAEPIVVAGMDQFVEQLRETPYWKVDGRGGVFWGPGERLANLWYPPGGGEVNLRLNVIDGRTGDARAVPMPAGVVLPQWAVDGSGVLLGNSPTDLTPRRLLRLDGTVVDAATTMAKSSCQSPQGFEFACLAPDDSMIAEIGAGKSASPRGARLTAVGSGTSFEIEGSFAGWLDADR